MSGLGDLFVNIRANATGLVSGLAHSQKKLRKFSRSAARTGRQMHGLSRGMTKFGVSLAGPLVLGVREFAKFEKSMANVATMLDAPRKHIGAFTSEVSRMSVEFGESTDALSGGLYDILSASIAPAKAMETLRVAVKAAKAGMTDTKTAADAITTVLNSYGMEASEAGRVSDILFTIVKGGKTTFGELAPSIGKVSSLASLANVSLEELATSIAVLTKNGIKTDEAMTGIKAVIGTFANATPDAQEAAEKFGLTLSTATLQAIGLMGAIRKLDNLSADQLAKIMPNKRALTGMAVAVNDIKGFDSQLKKMNNVLGATDRAFSIVADTASMSLDQMWQGILQVSRALGGTLTQNVRLFGSSVVETTAKITRWIEINAQLIRDIVGWLPSLAAVTAGIYALGTAMKVAAAAATISMLPSMKKLGFLLRPGGMLLGGLAAGFIALRMFASYMRGPGFSAMQSAAVQARHNGEALQDQAAKAKELLKRLQELSEVTRMNHGQMREAQNATRTLNTNFGDLGISVDATTGKIQGLTGAMERLTAAERKNASESLKLQIRAQKEQLKAARDAMFVAESKSKQGWLESPISNVLDSLGVEFGDEGKSVKEWAAAIDNLKNSIRDLQAARADMADADRAESSGMLAPSAAAAAAGSIADPAALASLAAAGDSIRRLVETPEQILERQFQHLEELFAQGAITREVGLAAADVYRKQMQDANKQIADGLITELERAGKALTEQLQTPAEILEGQIADITAMLAAKVIDDETFRRAELKFRKDFEEATKSKKPPTAQQQPGSIQTVTGAFKFNNLSTTAAALQQAKDQTKLQQQIANNTSRQNKQLAKLGPTP